MKPADIIILLIVIVAMVFAARKAAGHFRETLSAAEAAMEVPRNRRENSWTALFLEPGRSASKACIASTAWIL